MRREYTKEEAEICLQIINNSGLKKIEAFPIAAKKINAKENDIKSAYYRKTSWMNNGGYKWFIDNKNINVCMMHIKSNPDNLSHAFRLASKETGLSISQLRYAWYGCDGFLNKYRKNKFVFRIFGFFNIFKKNVKNNILKGKSSL